MRAGLNGFCASQQQFCKTFSGEIGELGTCSFKLTYMYQGVDIQVTHSSFEQSLAMAPRPPPQFLFKAFI